MNTTIGLGGSTPQFNLSGRSAAVLPFYHSYAENALILDATIMGGFGHLAQGTVMATYGEYIVPYIPTTISASDPGRSFLSADVAAAKVLYMTNEAARKFAVGHTIVASDTDDTYTDCGEITAISIDAVPGLTAVTVTNNVTATVAKSANVYHKTGTTGKFSVATCLIDAAVSTGYAEYPTPAGANVSILLSNAVIYTNALVGMDAAAITSLGVVTRGKYTILK
jgi:hypothetical protein